MLDASLAPGSVRDPCIKGIRGTVTEQVTLCPSVASESMQAFPPLPHLCTWVNTHPPAPHNHIHTRVSVSVGSVPQVMLTVTKDQYTCLGVELFVVEMGILLRKSKAL